MTVDAKPLIEINQLAVKVLFQQLGAVDAVRFLRQFITGFGDYTQEREKFFESKSLADIIQEIENQRK
ncbi:MAG: hypothetical protein Q9P14_17700 [candidate division KSB1 bacterium]|nr:hypothetical protein [candidate division KSB1 bacterium]MDQ7066484.1 hypothetical protein [candidate division KSB1 bacterium]